MNPEQHSERVLRNTLAPRPSSPADALSPRSIDAELAAAQRELATEHIQLADALAHAESALGMRDEVLAIVAHDLRAPLNAVQTSASFLMDEELSAEERARLLMVIKRAASGMNRLIEDLLDVTRIESGALTVDLEPINLSALLAEVCEQFRTQAIEAGRTLECRIESPDAYAIADRVRISQVLENLIANGLKFTGAGGHVLVQLSRVSGAVRVAVADTGVGIAVEDLPHLFERFWQARRYRRGGAGLGLAIARGIVHAHGSSLEVRSEAGRGSEFSFHLPAVPA